MHFNDNVGTEQLPLTNKHFYSWIAGAVLSALALQLFWIHQGLFSITWDESGRALSAYSFIHNYKLFFGTWLPFYRIVVGLGLILFPDLLLTPRIITFILGLASVIAISWFSHVLFRDKRVTAITAILAACFSQRIVISIAPLSSIMFDLVIIIALTYFTKWLIDPHDKYVLLCAAFLALSCTIRYEGWIFSAVFSLIVLFHAPISWNINRTTRPAPLLVSVGLVVLFPLFWMALWVYIKGNALGFLEGGASYYPSLMTIILKNPFVEFLKANIICINIIGLIPLFHYSKTIKPVKALILLLFLPLLILSAVLLIRHQAQSGPSWRDVVVWSLFIVPFNAKMIGDLFKSQYLIPIVSIFLLLVIYQMDVYRIKEDSDWVFRQYEISAGQYLSKYIKTNATSKIYIECSHYQCLNIIAASQQPDSFIWGDDAQSKSLFSNMQINKGRISQKDIRLLIFDSDLYKQHAGSAHLTKTHDFGRWAVYAAR